MNLSEFITKAIKEVMQTNKLTDSQLKFTELFEATFKMVFETYFKQIMIVLNRIDLNSKISIKQQDFFMQQLKIPQTMDELDISFLPHPITEKAEEVVVKDLRKMMEAKQEMKDE